MKRQGRAGEALGISLWSGVVGSLFGLAMLILMTEPLSRLALAFRPTSYCASACSASASSPRCPTARCSKGLAAAAVGMMIATVGTDPISGVSRFTFGLPGAPRRHRADPRHGRPVRGQRAAAPIGHAGSGIGGGVPRCACACRVSSPCARSARRRRSAASSGPFEGLMPGGGGSIAAFISYNEAKRWSKVPGGVRQGLRRGRRRARDRQQHGGQHRADPAPLASASRARTRPRCCSAASSSTASCRARACSSRTPMSSSGSTSARSSPRSPRSSSASSSCRSASGS